jgi:NTE family protein
MDLKRRRVALVLGGGGALGAFHGGVFQALSEAGLLPTWVSGTSIGAFNAAIIAGNPPPAAGTRLEGFWDHLAETEPPPLLKEGELRRYHNMMAGLRARLFGRPGLFLPSLPRILGSAPYLGGQGLYDLAPGLAVLERLVDFERTRRGETRLTVNATDVRTGDRVVFDSTVDELGLQHILASASLMPEFGPVEIDGRLLADGGFSANLPLASVLERTEEDLLCVAVELFGFDGTPVASRTALAERANDMTYLTQTRQAVALAEARHRCRALASAARQPSIVLAVVLYTGRNEGTDQKLFDFSRTSLSERWQAGYRQTSALPSLLRQLDEPEPGSFAVHWLDDRDLS